MKKAKSDTAGGERRELRITLVRSLIGYPQNQRVTARGLGLGKLNSSVTRRDGPEIRGMINKISHLVKVEVISK
jgi:large subunit ribosomal protein L30